MINSSSQTSSAKLKQAVSLAGMHVSFSHKSILHDLNLEVKSGKFVCLVGESGSGKTTILRVISGLLQADKGNVTIFGKPLVGINNDAAMVFQSFGLFPWLTVYENASFPYTIRGLPIPHTLIEQSLKEVGLENFHQRYPRDLSGGQRQRVGIARALAVQRPLLLLDEPFSALDIKTATELRRDLAALCKAKNLTVIMVSHLVEEAVELADSILVIRKGEIASHIAVDLPKPRDQESAPFLELSRRIKGIIEE
jgi:NitT/TauT family transport system ATP-binding protein